MLDRLGSAVRRLRQRRAGDLRPVLRLGGGQMEAIQRAGVLPAARLRGAGPGAFLRAAGALPALCADNNMQVVYPTTPAQIFHVLRAADEAQLPQAADRDDAQEPSAPSGGGQPVEDARQGTLPSLLDDPSVHDPEESAGCCCAPARCTTICPHREKVQRDDVAVVRMEQLYPLRRRV